MPDDEEREPQILSEIEARSNLTTLAGLARHYYLSLIAEGFEEQQAMLLVIAKTTS